jgi:hypothetical protein
MGRLRLVWPVVGKISNDEVPERAGECRVPAARPPWSAPRSGFDVVVIWALPLPLTSPLRESSADS